ncbi:MAG: RloB domain-containing protein [Kiritimatiellae bacterium]|nr:RloB domain-containing protein [Kiritimatiellia bacterium]
MPKKRLVKRSLRPVFYIFCEGSKTEPYYLEHYIKNHCQGFRAIQVNRIKLDDIVKIPKTTKTDPISLVNMAVRQKSMSPSPDRDRYWCAYDREAESTIPSKYHIKAFKEASDNGIKVAFSNVCFEVWLLLHKQEGCASYDSCDDLLKRSRMREFYPEYKKGCRREFADAEITVARKRAAKMNEGTCKGHALNVSDALDPSHLVELNPYTNFYQLLDSIDAFLASQA